MHEVKRTYKLLSGEEKELTFGPLPIGYMKANRELMKKVCLQSSIDDLIEQEAIALESLKIGMGEGAFTSLDALTIPDMSDALFATMEASGFLFQRAASGATGERKPTGT